MPEDLKHRSGDVVSARKLNGIVDRLPEDQQGDGAASGAMNRSSVLLLNSTGAAVDQGDLLTVGAYEGPTDIFDAQGNASFLGDSAVWHSNIARLAIAIGSIPLDERGRCVSSGIVLARFGSLDNSKPYAQVDPDDTAVLKSASGGMGKLLGVVDSTHGIVDLGSVQHAWRYKTTASVPVGGGEVAAELLELDGTTYANVTLSFPATLSPRGLDEGTEGTCIQSGNEFFATNTERDPCKVLCECKPYAMADPSPCEPPACSTGTRTGVRIIISGAADCTDDDGCSRPYSQANGTYEFIADLADDNDTDAQSYCEQIVADGCGEFSASGCHTNRNLQICVTFKCLTGELAIDFRVQIDRFDGGGGCTANCAGDMAAPNGSDVTDDGSYPAIPYVGCCDGTPDFPATKPTFDVAVEFF